MTDHPTRLTACAAIVVLVGALVVALVTITLPLVVAGGAVGVLLARAYPTFHNLVTTVPGIGLLFGTGAVACGATWILSVASVCSEEWETFRETMECERH